MLVFKDPINNRLAIIIGEYLYFSNLEGQIYKHYETERFDANTFTENSEFPIDFEEAEAEYWDKENKIDTNYLDSPKAKEALKKCDLSEISSVKRKYDNEMAL